LVTISSRLCLNAATIPRQSPEARRCPAGDCDGLAAEVVRLSVVLGVTNCLWAELTVMPQTGSMTSVPAAPDAYVDVLIGISVESACCAGPATFTT
jgi:hypothetical protein